MKGVQIKDIDRGAKALRERVKEISRAYSLSVGIHAKEGGELHEDSPLTILELAVIHEFGLGVPERSFIRAYFEENEKRLLKMAAASAQAVAEGKFGARVALERLGQKIVGEIQDRIKKHIPPPLAESTIARKGSDVPLIDTGQLRSSITYSVDEK